MTIKEIYAIPETGKQTIYAHFFFGLLIPLLYYDIRTKHAHIFIIKINVATFEHILTEIFKKRVMFDYIVLEKYNVELTDKYNYFDLYIELLKNKDVNYTNNIILLPAFDMFEEQKFFYINKRLGDDNVNFPIYEKKYVDYYSEKNDPTLNKKLFNQMKEKYKTYNFTDKYFKLIMYKKSIDRFLNNTYNSANLPSHNCKILLIERPYKPFNADNIYILNTSGQRRIIYNHEDLKNTLSKLYKGDFMNISLDNLTFEKQYYLFKNAKIVIAQHGSGLCNLFFSKPNFKTHLIEISPKWNQNLNAWFKNLSELCEINYYNVKQPKMTNEEWKLFSSKYNIKYKQSKIMEEFIENSGSVNINEIANIVKKILH
jgi:hypothetical protein